VVIYFKCWKCSTNLESNETAIGQRKTCPKCETPNLVPKPFEAETTDDSDLCFFCKKRPSLPELSSIVMVKQSVGKMTYHCRNCKTNWDEPREKKAESKQIYYIPQCPSCKNQNFDNEVIPLRLPPMPVGRWYTSFYFTFNKIGDYSGSPELVGYVGIPRCHKCNTIHKIIKGVSWALALTVAFLVPIILVIVLPKDQGYSKPPPTGRLLQTFAMMFFSFLIFGIPIMFLSRFVMRYVIGWGTLPERSAKTFPTVRHLHETGWTHIKMCPSDLANYERSALAHKYGK